MTDFRAGRVVQKLKVSLLAAALCFLCGCHSDSNAAKPDTTNAAVPAPQTLESPLTQGAAADAHLQFTSATGLSLPADAEIVFYEAVAGSDQLLRVVAIMTRASFAIWITDLQLDFSRFSEDSRYLLGPNTGAWLPQAPATLPTAQVRFDNGKTLDLGYQPLPQEQLKIYLVFHGS